MPRKAARTKGKVRIFFECASDQSDKRIYNIPILPFALNAKTKFDPHLGDVQKVRFERWMKLRAALQYKTATSKHREGALNDMASMLRGVFPATLELVACKPKGEPQQIAEMWGRLWGVWQEDSSEVGDGKVLSKFVEAMNKATTPQEAYDFLTFAILRLAMFAEWEGSPAILCRKIPKAEISSLEVAHYVRALLNNHPKWCLECNGVFAPTRSDQEFCGDKCKWKAIKTRQRKHLAHAR